MRIALITDPLRRNYPEAIQHAYHRSLHHVVENIAQAIKALGHAFKHLEANHHLQDAIENLILILCLIVLTAPSMNMALHPHLNYWINLRFPTPVLMQITVSLLLTSPEQKECSRS